MQAEINTGSGRVIDEALLRRLDVPGPRYTSYPTADRFVEAFDAECYRRALRERAQGARVGGAPPLSLYVHVPFCESVCYYCACNKVITRHHERAAEYLDALDAEIALHVAELGAGRPATQVHFGGGTPTFLSDEELTLLAIAALGLRHRRRRRGVDRGRPAHRDPRAPGAPGRDGLQPRELRRAGLRPHGAAGGAPRAEPRACATWSRRRAARLPSRSTST
jgi:hypothetical protein